MADLDLTNVAAVLAEAARRAELRAAGLPLHTATAPRRPDAAPPTRGITRKLPPAPAATRPASPPEAWAKLGREFVEQIRLFDWIDTEGVASYSELEETFAVPNAGMRSAFSGGGLRRAGLRKGVPDVLLPVPRAGYVGLALELKVEGGKVEPAQAALHERWRRLGWRVSVVVGWLAARDALVEYVAGAVVRLPAVPEPL